MKAKEYDSLLFGTFIMVLIASVGSSYNINNRHLIIKRSRSSTHHEREGFTTQGTADDYEDEYDLDDYYDDLFKDFELNKKELDKDLFPKKYSHHEEKEWKVEPLFKEISSTKEPETIVEDIEHPVINDTAPRNITKLEDPLPLPPFKDPLALPPITEITTTQDPLKVFGMPEELMPIKPKGGSTFDDIEMEKAQNDNFVHGNRHHKAMPSHSENSSSTLLPTLSVLLLNVILFSAR